MRRADIIAGLSVSGLVLPEAVAYAAIAGLPAGRAVLAGIAGCLAYALAGRSRLAILTPTSSGAAVLAGLMAAAPLGSVDPAALATAATLLAGVILLAGAALGLGGLAALIPRPVLRGFAFGIALSIILRQMPVLAGIGAPAGAGPWAAALALLRHGADLHGPSLACGAAALALYALLRRRAPRGLPVAFTVLAAGAAGSWAFGLQGRGVALAGHVAVTPGLPAWPALSTDEWWALAGYVVPLALILLAESWGTIRALGLSQGDETDSGRELTGLGLANLASALAQGMPVGAGFSAGAAAGAAGAASIGTGLAVALSMAALVYLAAPAVALLPLPVIAAVVIGTLAPALSPAPFLRLYRLGRDFRLAVASAAAVLALGVLQGLMVSVFLSLAVLLRRLMRPRLARLGRLAGSRAYVDLARHPGATAPAGVMILRPAEPLFFANAEAILGRIRDAALKPPRPGVVILSLEETSELDTTTLDALTAFDDGLARAGVTLRLARLHDHMRDTLAAAGAGALIARASYSVDDAVAAATAQGLANSAASV